MTIRNEQTLTQQMLATYKVQQIKKEIKMNLIRKTTIVFSILFASCMFLLATPGLALAVEVDPDPANSLDFIGCGVSGAVPCRTIGFAISETPPNGTITLTVGIYIGSSNRNLTVNKNLIFQGAGIGDTILDAEGADRHFTIEKDVYDENVNVEFRDMILRNGRRLPTSHGGSIYVPDGADALTFERIEFTNNTTDYGWGGAIYCPKCESLTIRNSQLTNNYAHFAGAFYSASTKVVVRQTTLEGNTALYDGGAIYKENDNLLVVDSRLINNVSLDGKGGGIYSQRGLTNVARSALAGNQAGEGGGIYIKDLVPNRLMLFNSTISGNSADSGGGLWADGPPRADIRNVTFYGNEGEGPAIYGSNVTLKNSIIMASIPIGSDLSDCSGSSITGDGNLIDVDCGSAINNLSVTNLDANLQFNGGPTETHAMDPSSNAVDGGVDGCPDVSGNPLPFDQRLVARPQGTACDIGAFELQ